jgi:ABC-type multidrug transport system ATPase subunit
MIRLDNVGKRFRFEWIFKNISSTFEAGKTYAILGPNGSGKSTLMKILSGHLTPSVGGIFFEQNGKKVDVDEVYQQVSFAAPYIELIEEMTLREMIDFHTRFKPLSAGLTPKDLIELLGYPKSADKEIRYFSSGMKQRLKLALAIATNAPILLLDEPTTNLDLQGIDWYRHMIDRFALTQNRIVIIASNIEYDYAFCTERMRISDFK